MRVDEADKCRPRFGMALVCIYKLSSVVHSMLGHERRSKTIGSIEAVAEHFIQMLPMMGFRSDRLHHVAVAARRSMIDELRWIVKEHHEHIFFTDTYLTQPSSIFIVVYPAFLRRSHSHSLRLSPPSFGASLPLIPCRPPSSFIPEYNAA